MIPYSDIERVARRMCEAMGVDPQERRHGTQWHALTTQERIGTPYEMAQGWVSLSAWRWMVPHAERAIAAHMAIDGLVNDAWHSKKGSPS